MFLGKSGEMSMPSAKVFHRELFLKNLTIRFTVVFQMDFAVKKEVRDE